MIDNTILGWYYIFVFTFGGAKMAKKSYELDMTQGPLFKKIIIFTIPLMLSSMLQLLYNAADIVVVGKFAGDEALAAVGSTSSLINLIVTTFVGLSLGAGVIVAQSIGAKNISRLTRTVHTSMSLSVVFGFSLTIIGILLASPMLKLMGSPEDVIGKATLYMRIYFLGMPAFMVYNFGAAILRSAGDTRRPLTILSISGIANVGFNLLFVIVFEMGVSGVAIATIISQYISAVWVVIILINEDDAYKLSIKKLRIYKTEFLQILSYGMPMGIQGACFSISNVIIQSSINSLGTIYIAGNSAAGNIEGFVHQAASCVGQSAIAFSGQNSGAGNYKRVKKVLINCYSLSILFGLTFGLVVFALKTQLLSIYTNNPEVISAGVERMNIMCLLYFLCGMMDATANVTRGMGKSLVPMIITLLFVCVFRVIWIYTIFETFKTATSVYLSYPITWILAIIGQLIYFAIVYRSLIKQKNADV